jgi:hypothetical protein
VRSSSLAVSAGLLFTVFTGGASAADAPPACAKLLTAAEIGSAVGLGFQSVNQEESAPGVSDCMWLLDQNPNPKAIGVLFTQKSAAPGGNWPGFFEDRVKHAEQVHESKREAVPGMGTRAALVPGKKPGAMILLIVEMPEGVAYVETDYLDRAQVLRVGKAIAGS